MTKNRIKELRNSANPKITLKELSEKLKEKGLSFTDSQLSYYENGKRSPRSKVADDFWQALSEFFSVSVPYIKGDSDYKSKDEATSKYFDTNKIDPYANSTRTVIEGIIVQYYGEKVLKKIKNNLSQEVVETDLGSLHVKYSEYTSFLTALSALNDDFFDILVTLASLDDNKRESIISFIKNMID